MSDARQWAQTVARRLAEIDWAGEDRFEWKFGGDGDNGEDLIGLLEKYFREENLGG